MNRTMKKCLVSFIFCLGSVLLASLIAKFTGITTNEMVGYMALGYVSSLYAEDLIR